VEKSYQDANINRFNPRARVGRDIANMAELESFIVSIHAPAWGATP